MQVIVKASLIIEEQIAKTHEKFPHLQSESSQQICLAETIWKKKMQH